MAIRNVFKSINEKGPEHLKAKYLLLTSMMSFGIQSSFGYDAQLCSKIARHALKDGERGITSGNWALRQVCGSELTEFYERQLILITALPN